MAVETASTFVSGASPTTGVTTAVVGVLADEILAFVAVKSAEAA
jgi:hypothetical protein